MAYGNFSYGTSTYGGETTRLIILTLNANEVIYLSDSRTIDVSSFFSESVGITDLFGSLFLLFKELIEEILISDVLMNFPQKVLKEVVALYDNFTSFLNKTLFETINLIDNIKNDISVIFVEIVRMVKRFIASLPGYLMLSKNILSWTAKDKNSQSSWTEKNKSSQPTWTDKEKNTDIHYQI